MRSPSVMFRLGGRCAAAAQACLVAGTLLLPAPSASAQDAAPQAQPAPVSKPGLINAIGRWLDQGTANFRSHLRGARQRMDSLSDEAAENSKDINSKAAEAGKSAVEATKNAVDAVAKLPVARMMSGHERCVTAPNGAPDCLAAAKTLCRKQGFSSGKSMDFTSAEECPARALLSGQQGGAQCTTVTFISRAMCQ